MRMFSDIPVLMLTARDTEMDEIRVLETGADDFMSKPFSLAVLKARIRNLLKRKAEKFTLALIRLRSVLWNINCFCI